VNCTPNHLCSKNEETFAAETPSDQKVMGAVCALHEFSEHVSYQNHANVSLKGLDTALKRGYKKNGCFLKTENASATTLVSVRNTRVFQTALTALTEPCTL